MTVILMSTFLVCLKHALQALCFSSGASVLGSFRYFTSSPFQVAADDVNMRWSLGTTVLPSLLISILASLSLVHCACYISLSLCLSSSSSLSILSRSLCSSSSCLFSSSCLSFSILASSAAISASRSSSSFRILAFSNSRSRLSACSFFCRSNFSYLSLIILSISKRF